MQNLIKRISLALVSIPVLLVLVFLLSFSSHLLLNLLIVALSILGALETRNLFLKRNIVLNPVITSLVSALFPVLNILIVMGLISENMVLPVFISCLSLLIIICAFSRNNDHISTTLNRLPSYFFILIFPGLFMSYLIRFNLLSESSMLIVIFLSFVFGNDTFAYFFGMLFGKNNRGIFAVSSNKSVAGLLGGICFSGLAGYIYYLFFPELFNNSFILAILIGVSIAGTAVIGDLFESALKRSAEEKDSGTIMRGRGGVLDTIDSVLFSAPLFFYIMYHIQFING